MKRPELFKVGHFFFIFLFFVISQLGAQVAVPFDARLDGESILVRGDLTFLANNILNTREERDGSRRDPNDSYDDQRGSNNSLPMEYIDIDGDNSTFSSSSSDLALPSCARVVYAGLYWGGSYPFNKGYLPDDKKERIIDSRRNQPYESVKIKVPGGNYVDIGPNSSAVFDYHKIYDKNADLDGDGVTDPGLVEVDGRHVPYLNYANVTHLLAALGDNADGTYTVANVVGSREVKGGGNFAGWTLVVIYEDLADTYKYISTFDGFVNASGNGNYSFPVSGFRTVPSPLPVKAKVGASAMEGDGQDGPELSFSPASKSGFTKLENNLNPRKNFFNRTITIEDNWVTTRVPASENTLGWDADIINLDNPNNKVLPNNETAGEFRLKAPGDSVFLFLLTMSVEVYEPEMLVVKTVEDGAGNSIANTGAQLGDDVQYVITYENIGNDDARNFTIVDKLPDNLKFDSVDLSGAPGATFAKAGRTLTFEVSNSRVEVGDPTGQIIINAKVSSNCNDFLDACSEIISNTALSSYSGETSGTVFTDRPSAFAINSCGQLTVTPTVFPVTNLASCNFDKQELLCASSVVLQAGSGFTTYVWAEDVNGNGQLDGADIILNDNDPDNDPSTMTVDKEGEYLVQKNAPAGCLDAMERITVALPGNTQANPVVALFNQLNADNDPSNDIQGEIVSCAVDGSTMPHIFLCGQGASQTITLDIPDDNNQLVWEKLKENSCGNVSDSCANRDNGCTWDIVGNGDSFDVTQAGEYRVIVNYNGGCFSRFYFNVYQNNLAVNSRKDDIHCNAAGSVEVTNLGAGYAYQLIDVANPNTPVVPFAAGNGPQFNITTAGKYVIQVQQLDPATNQPVVGGCLFETSRLNVKDLSLNIQAAGSTILCDGGLGTIKVDATNARANYAYELYADDGSGNPATTAPLTAQTASPNNTHTFSGLNAGKYVIVVKNDDGCVKQTTAEVIAIPALSLAAVKTRDIGCLDGEITVKAQGGAPNPNYLYAIWSKDGTGLYADINAIPAADYQINPVFSFPTGEAGDYEIVVVDGNNCYAISNAVTVVEDGAPALQTPTVVTAIQCNGGSNGAIQLNLTGGKAPFLYSIDDGVTTQSTPDFVNLAAGGYNLFVSDANGCEARLPFTLTEPAVFAGMPELQQDASCSVNGTANYSFVNVSGGVAPYEYSFDGTTFGSNTAADLAPGNYTLKLRDALGCELQFPITVAAAPAVPNITPSVAYNCDGTATITLATDQPAYDYIYEIDGVANTPASSNVFDNLPQGTQSYAFRVRYKSSTAATSCERVVTLNYGTQAGQAFEVAYLRKKDVSCNGGADGSLTFSVTNFDATAGFEYSTDNGTTWTQSASSPVTTAAQFSAGSVQVRVRRVNDTSCEETFSENIMEPQALSISGSVIKEISCNDPTATIAATVSGGAGPYEYQLEDDNGAVVVAYPNPGNALFTGLAPGDYIVRVRDDNGCEMPLASAITVADKESVDFTVQHTQCYDGANNATIQIDVTNGNGGYQYQINGGPWVSPTPAASTYTFSGLAAGTYTVNVKDAKGCEGTMVSRTIDTQLLANAVVADVKACADGSITVNASGGQGALVYAFVANGVAPTAADFGVANILAVTNANAGTFDVYVRDNNGVAPYCEESMLNVVVDPAIPLVFNPTPTDPECFDGLGSVQIGISSGKGPFTYTLVDLSPADGIDYGRSNTGIVATTHNYAGVGVGNYQVTVADADGCTETSATFSITNAVEITADVLPILPADCNNPSNTPTDFGFEFVNVTTPTGTVEYSADGGATWQASHELRGHVSGTAVNPSIKVTLASGTVCIQDFPRYIVPFPLDDLDLSLSVVVVNCNDMQVTVTGQQGDITKDYEYTFTDDPANFNAFAANPGVWSVAQGAGVPYTFSNINPTTPHNPNLPLLVPGREYTFYVRNDGCIRQNTIPINQIPGLNLPIDITYDVTPSCQGAANGGVTFTLNPDTAYPQMRWELYELGNATPIEVSGGGVVASNVPYSATITASVGLNEGSYFIDIVQVDALNADTCRGGSETAYVPELPALNATAAVARDISCNLPGLIAINGISGGGGAPYTYDVSGPAGFTTLTGLSINPVEIPVNSPAGDYTVTLNDQYGCPFTTNTVTLSLTPNPVVTNAVVDNCAAPLDVQVTATSAAGNFRYAIVPDAAPVPTSFLDNSGLFNNMAPGDYDVYVIDGNGCVSAPYDLLVHPVLEANAALSKTLDCSATPDAEITLDVTLGSGTYSYQVLDAGGATVHAKTAFGAGVTNAVVAVNAADTYSVIIFDDNTPDSPQCNRTFMVNVPAAVLPVFNATPRDVSCNGGSDGVIIVTETDKGINPLSYTLNPMPAGALYDVASKTFTNVPPGTYAVEATGTNSCVASVTGIVVNEPALMSIPAIASLDFSCAIGNTVSQVVITVNPATITGGSGTYVRYKFEDPNGLTLQNNANNSLVVTDISGGNYTVYVYDDKGCSASTVVTVNPLDDMGLPTVSVDDAISCTNGGEDVTVAVQGSLSNSATPPHNYEFALVGTPGTNTDGVFQDLAVGVHTFMVTNTATGCSRTVTHQVNRLNDFDFDIQKNADVACFGTETGEVAIQADATFYIGDYTYTITDVNDATYVKTGNGNTASLSAPISLRKGSFNVEISQTAFPFCTSIQKVVVIGGPDAAITATVAEQGNAACTNDQGSLLVDPDGGIGPFNITVSLVGNPAVTQTQNNVDAFVFTGLEDGSYDVSVTDTTGCTDTFSGSIAQVNPLVAAINTYTAVLDCIGDKDGELTAVVSSGGVGTIQYQLETYNGLGGALVSTSAQQTTNTFGQLAKGVYAVLITDEAGCQVTTNQVEIGEPSEIVATLTRTTALTCTVDATITLTASAGGAATGQYEYSTDGVTFTSMSGGDTHTFTVGAGSYSYWVRDADQCNPVQSNTVTENPVAPLSLAIDDSFAKINCFGNAEAVIFARASGGLGAYAYTLYDDPAFTTVVANNTTGEFRGLAAGTYYVRVDSQDCSFTSAAITINEPTPLQASFDQEDVSCNGEADGSITVNLSGGSGGYQYAISPNLSQFTDQNVFENLEAGDYTIIGQDQNGCFEVLDVTITQPDALGLTYTKIHEQCANAADGEISITITGGVAPYRTSFNSNNDADFVAGQTVFTGLTGGNYVIFVKDANDCETNVIVEIDAGANLNATVAAVYECTADVPTNRIAVTMEDPAVLPDVLFGLNTTDPNQMQLSPDFSDLAPGMYELNILYSNGCSNAVSFEVDAFDPLTLTLDNTNINQISATATGGSGTYTYYLDDDAGQTDNVFNIRKTDTYTVRVQDSNGCEASAQIEVEFIDVEFPKYFTPDGDGNNDVWMPLNITAYPDIEIIIFDRYGREMYRIAQGAEGWRGFYEDIKVPAGDYWYIIKLNGEEDKREFIGNFTLYR